MHGVYINGTEPLDSMKPQSLALYIVCTVLCDTTVTAKSN